MTERLMVIGMRLDRLRHVERGASLIEYALLLGLIAMVCIVGVSTLGQKTNSVYNSMAQKL